MEREPLHHTLHPAQSLHACQRRRGHVRRCGSGKDEPRRLGADGVHNRRRARDVTPNHTVGLSQCALNNVHLPHDLVPLCHPSTMRAVHPHGVDLVQVGQGVVLAGEVADIPDRGDRPRHGVHRLEGDHSGSVGVLQVGGLQELLQVLEVIVAPDELLDALALHPVDHRGVVLVVAVELAPRKQRPQGAQSGLVGDVAAVEHQRRLLVVVGRKLPLQQDVGVSGTADVPGAPGARAPASDGIGTGLHHLRVLSHPQVVVAAPHHNLLSAAVLLITGRVGEVVGVALHLCEHAVAALLVEVLQEAVEVLGDRIIHLRKGLDGVFPGASGALDGLLHDAGGVGLAVLVVGNLPQGQLRRGLRGRLHGDLRRGPQSGHQVLQVLQLLDGILGERQGVGRGIHVQQVSGHLWGGLNRLQPLRELGQLHEWALRRVCEGLLVDLLVQLLEQDGLHEPAVRARRGRAGHACACREKRKEGEKMIT
eukprot:RCo053080